MRKYHIADVLVLVRFVLAALLLALGLLAPFEWGSGRIIGIGLALYVIAELTDAFDGPAARRWHYPRDGKHRWWRENGMNSLLDKAADLTTAIAMSLLLFWRETIVWSVAVVVVGAMFATYCLTMEIEVRSSFDLAHERGDVFWERRFSNALLKRRVAYLLYLLWLAMLALWTCDWPLVVKVVVTLVGILGLLVLARYKRDRLTEVDTGL